jgi:hypothetical protein
MKREELDLIETLLIEALVELKKLKRRYKESLSSEASGEVDDGLKVIFGEGRRESIE